MARLLQDSNYSSAPYLNRGEYIEVLMSIAVVFNEDMKKIDSKGNNMLSVLRRASTPKHFGYLQNGALLTHKEFLKAERLLCIGTTGSEALHRELGRWTDCVTLQHRERILLACNVFCYMKMSSRNAAAITRQRRKCLKAP